MAWDKIRGLAAKLPGLPPLKRDRHTPFFIVLILCTAAILISSVLFSSLRIDLTEDNRNTLSSGSRDVLSAFDQPIEVEFYYSARLLQQAPGYALYAPRLRYLLEEYQKRSGGKLHVTFIDPKPFSEEEDRAIAMGLQAIPLNAGTASAYFGLAAVSAGGKKAVIPLFDPSRESLAEYDLTRLVASLGNRKTPTIGVISQLPIDSDMFAMAAGSGAPAPWMFYLQLQQLFEVQKIAADAKSIPADIDLLMLVHPRALSEDTLRAIDQFMQKRGRAIFFVDPHSEAYAARRALNPDAPAESSNMQKLFDAWGVAFDPAQVVLDRNLAQRVVLEDVSQGKPRQKAVDYAAWLRLSSAQFNNADPVSEPLRRLNFATAGSVAAKSAALRFTPLVETTEGASVVSSGLVKFNPDAEGLLQNYVPGGQKYALAARFQGRLPSAFGSAAKDAAESAFIVIADTDFLEDRFWVRGEDLSRGIVMPIANNADLVLNAVENLTGSDALLEIRSRATSLRPLLVMEKLRHEAEDRFAKREQELRGELQFAQQELQKIQSGNASDKDQKTIEAVSALRQKIAGKRQELREVQYSLNEDMERITSLVRFLNIVLWPLLLGVALYFLRHFILPFQR